jgi:hypothetical protein
MADRNREDLSWYEIKDLRNKGLLPEPEDELLTLAVKMVGEKDRQEGEHWSEITEEIAKLMVAFHNSL